MWKKITAPAKINLYLEVIQRLPSGFHEIVSLAVPLSLCDTLSASPASELSLEIQIPQEEKYLRLFSGQSIPTDDSNLVLRAACLLRNHLAFRRNSAHAVSGETTASASRTAPAMDGAKIILEKRIPSQAGMGGGSSDAASALLLLNELWQGGLTRSELCELGAQLGSDVPLFLQNFPVICRGRGEILESVPEGESFPKLHFVVVKPTVGCSTPEVYRRCTPQPNHQSQKVLTELIRAWRLNQLEELSKGFQNRLLEPALDISPKIKQLLDRFKEMPNPCIGVSMTGSGSACFGLCRDKAHAADAAEFFEHHDFGTVFVTETVLASTKILNSHSS